MWKSFYVICQKYLEKYSPTKRDFNVDSEEAQVNFFKYIQFKEFLIRLCWLRKPRIVYYWEENEFSMEHFKAELQSWTKCLQTFSLFSIICLQHKWNGTRLLLPQRECASFLTSCRTTKDPRKLGNFKKVTEMLGSYGQYPVTHPKHKFWRLSVKSRKISPVKQSIKKNLFCLISWICLQLLSKIVDV